MSDDDYPFHMPTDAERQAQDRSRKLQERATAAAEAGKFDKAIEFTKEALDAARGGGDEWSLRYLEGRLADLLIQADRADEARVVLEASLASSEAMRAKARNDHEERQAGDIPASLRMLRLLYEASDNYDGLARLFRTYDREDTIAARPPRFDGARSVMRLAGRMTELATGGVWDPRPLEVAIELTRETGNGEVLFAVEHERGAAAAAIGDDALAISTYSDLVRQGSRYEPTVTRLLVLLETSGRTDEAMTVAKALAADSTARGFKAELDKRIERLAKKKATTTREKQSGPTDASTFGRVVRDVANAEALLDLETEMGRGERFEELDRIVTRLISRKLTGQIIWDTSNRKEGLRLVGIPSSDRSFIDEAFSRPQLEARGAWFLPDRVTTEQSARKDLIPGSAPAPAGDPIFAWALLQPLLDALHRPLELRELSASMSNDRQKAAWHGVADLLGSLGIDARLELDSTAYGGGWSRLKADERRAVQDRLQAALVEWGPAAVRRFRVLKILELVRAYYAKADADGCALRTRVVTASLRQTVIAYFRGDWMAFLDYLGERPHAGEQIITALPESKFIVAGSDRIAAAAADPGLPPEQAALIGQAMWGASESPVEARVAALRGFWATFDAIHARQDAGMPSLWGLVEEKWELGSLNSGPGEHNAGLFRRTMPTGLLDEIDRLWGGELDPKWPDKVVSAISPHFIAAETFGPALKFWHGVALTAWFVCEGPISRTSIEDMETYYQRDLEVLEGLGSPIDRALFRDLISVRTTLKARRPDPTSRSTVEVADGISFELTISIGQDRLEGFSKLRDVITRYRGAWASSYLDSYLRKRWDMELRSAAMTFSRMTAEANKPPGIKPFARKVEATVDHWFGGDLGALYTSIDAKCPVAVTRPERVLPSDQFAFVEQLAPELFSKFRPVVLSKDERAKWENNRTLSDLARLAIKAVQMSEALGAMPSLKEIGAPAFGRAQRIRVVDRQYGEESALADDPEMAFAIFIDAIEAALSRMPQPSDVATSQVTAPVAAVSTALEAGPVSRPTPDSPPIEDPQAKGLLGRLFGKR